MTLDASRCDCDAPLVPCGSDGALWCPLCYTRTLRQVQQALGEASAALRVLERLAPRGERRAVAPIVDAVGSALARVLALGAEP